jgi:AraC-like DNA-binding protein
LKAAGTSPMRYAWSLRLEQAARLLGGPEKDDVRAKEVAYRCGFSDAAHFSRAFKARYGASPREFASLKTPVSGRDN